VQIKVNAELHTKCTSRATRTAMLQNCIDLRRAFLHMICMEASTEVFVLGPDQIKAMDDALAARGIPAAELCRRAGIVQTTWMRWKKGEVGPSYHKAQKVKQAFDELVPPQEAAE
jgi:hypothetical protein